MQLPNALISKLVIWLMGLEDTADGVNKTQKL